MIKIRNHGEVAAVVPHMLGYTPQDSLVLIGLDDYLVTFCARVDLDIDVSEYVAGMGEALLATDKRSVVVFLDEQPDSILQTWAPVLAGLDLFGPIVLVRDGYATCTDGCCEPMALADNAIGTQMAVEAGSAPAPTRADAIAVLDPEPLDAHWWPIVQPSGAGDWRHAVTLFADTRVVPTMPEALQAALISSLEDYRLRDSVLADLPRIPRPLLLQLAKAGQDGPHAAPILTLLALAYYSDGNAMLAQECIDRARRSRREYSLSDLVAKMLSVHVPPEVLRTMFDQTEVPKLMGDSA